MHACLHVEVTFPFPVNLTFYAMLLNMALQSAKVNTTKLVLPVKVFFENGPRHVELNTDERLAHRVRMLTYANLK